MSLTKVTYSMINGASFNVLDYGADRSGISDSTAAIQAAYDAIPSSGGSIYFPSGTYILSDTITITKNNVCLYGDSDATIFTPATFPSGQKAFHIDGADGCTVKNLNFLADGSAVGCSFYIYGGSVTNLSVSDCRFRRSAYCAVQVGGERIRVSNCDFLENYNFGVQFYLADQVAITNCTFDKSGDTGVEPLADYGRGIVVWRSTNVVISNCTVKNSSEYGVRFASFISETTANDSCAISNCVFENNGTKASGDRIDLFLTNGSDLLKSIAVSNCSFKINDNAVGLGIEGTNISVTNCVVKPLNDFSNARGILFYKAFNAVISSCVFENLTRTTNFSNTGVSSEILITNNTFNNCATIAGGLATGANIRICNNYAVHGGTGTTDFAIFSGSDVDNLVVSGNVVDGFYRFMEVGDNVAVISNNVTLNTTDIAVRKYGTTLDNLIIYGNTWDVLCAPTELSFTNKGGVGKSSNKTLYLTTTPTQLDFKVGDVVYNTSPSAGGNIGWVCTTAGTPGTWKTFGAISA